MVICVSTLSTSFISRFLQRLGKLGLIACRFYASTAFWAEIEATDKTLCRLPDSFIRFCGKVKELESASLSVRLLLELESGFKMRYWLKSGGRGYLQVGHVPVR